MADRDAFAAILATVPYPPVPPRDVALAAAKYGWYPDPPWFAPSQPQVKQP